VEFIRFQGGAISKNAIERGLKAMFKNCLVQHIDWEGNLKFEKNILKVIIVCKKSFYTFTTIFIFFSDHQIKKCLFKVWQKKMTGYVKNILRHAPTRVKTNSWRPEEINLKKIDLSYLCVQFFFVEHAIMCVFYVWFSNKCNCFVSLKRFTG
jgi:hypothetical protein